VVRVGRGAPALRLALRVHSRTLAQASLRPSKNSVVTNDDAGYAGTVWRLVQLGVCLAISIAIVLPDLSMAGSSVFRSVKFTECIRLTDGLYDGAPSAYSMLYSGNTDTRIAFAIVVTNNGHRPDRVGSIFATRKAVWINRFGAFLIRGFGPVVPRSDTTATPSEKVTLAKHVRAAELHCIAVAQH
jgi:hypothetical protein